MPNISSLSSKNFAGLIVPSVADPVSLQDAATKNYVDLEYLRNNKIQQGESNAPRNLISNVTGTTISGVLQLSFFTAWKTETITSVKTFCTSAQSGTAPTICRMGIYSVDGNGLCTLVSSVPNDTVLWNASGAFSRGFSPTSWSKVAGTRYAFGHIIVSTGTLPILVQVNTFANSTAYLAYSTAPRLLGVLLGQTDLPSSITEASLVATVVPRPWYAEFS